MLSASECNERLPVHRKSGWSQAERGLDLTEGQAVVTQNRASHGIREDIRWTKQEKPNKWKRRMGKDACQGGKITKGFGK